MKAVKYIVFFVSFIVFSNIAYGATTFTDVPKDHWAYDDINELRSLGVTDGIGDNLFGFGNPIKRSEFIGFLVKLMKWEVTSPEIPNFPDNADKSKWYYDDIETALKNGVLYEGGYFRPEENITREEMAVMIVRALGYDTLAKQMSYLQSEFQDVISDATYVTMAKDFKIVSGVGDNQFNPNATAKREEAAAMMMRMYKKMNNKLNELHGFYAIQSYDQMNFINSLNSVSFGWSRLELNGEELVLNMTSANGNEFRLPGGFDEPVALAKANKAAAQLMVSINYNDETQFAAKVLSSKAMRDKAIGLIAEKTNLTEKDGASVSFSGVTIDFENLRGSETKQNFNLFLQDLKKELAKTNKLLYVAVQPQRREGFAYFDGYDFKTIGTVADKIILMAHDYNPKKLTAEEMEIGFTTTPIAPIEEIYFALKSITSQCDSKKVLLQISFDSAQLKAREDKIISSTVYKPSYSAIRDKILQKVPTIYSKNLESPYIKFEDTADNTQNIVWYEDERSVAAKIKLANMFEIQGISLWRLGIVPAYEDSSDVYLNIWKAVK